MECKEGQEIRHRLDPAHVYNGSFPKITLVNLKDCSILQESLDLGSSVSQVFYGFP